MPGLAAGKMACLDALLSAMLAGTDDAMVIVSNSTAALDLVQARCAALQAPFVRIDGATDAAKRHDIVLAFNAAHSTYRASLDRQTGIIARRPCFKLQTLRSACCTATPSITIDQH